jgi:uncharacterized protein
MVWVVIAGPLSVVLACIATGVLAWKHIDPIIQEKPLVITTPSPATGAKAPLAPAVQARNHAATPEQR